MATPQAVDQPPVLRSDTDAQSPRPVQRPAFSAAIALQAELDAIARDSAIRAAVIAGAGTKVFYGQPDAGLEQAYALATGAGVCNMMAADAAEGIDAFMQKRSPQWQGR